MGRHMPWAEERPTERGHFDELVCKNVEMVHIEKMDSGHIWIGIYGEGGRVTVSLSSDRKIKGHVEHEPDASTKRNPANG